MLTAEDTTLFRASYNLCPPSNGSGETKVQRLCDCLVMRGDRELALSLIQSPCLIMMFPLGLRGCEKLNKEGFLEISPGILEKWHGRD